MLERAALAVISCIVAVTMACGIQHAAHAAATRSTVGAEWLTLTK